MIAIEEGSELRVGDEEQRSCLCHDSKGPLTCASFDNGDLALFDKETLKPLLLHPRLHDF